MFYSLISQQHKYKNKTKQKNTAPPSPYIQTDKEIQADLQSVHIAGY